MSGGSGGCRGTGERGGSCCEEASLAELAVARRPIDLERAGDGSA